MKRLAGVALTLGLALFAGLVAWQGLDAVGAAFAAAGWGVAAVVAVHLLPLTLDAAALRVLPGTTGRWRAALLGRWLGEAVNNLLPVAQLGGEVVKARVLFAHGAPRAAGAAAVIAALTLQAATQGLFAIAGLLLLATTDGSPPLLAIGAGIATFAGLIAAFYAVQRSGLAYRIADRLAPHYGAGAQALQQALHRLYGDARAVTRSALLLFAGWVAGIAEVWLALRFIGAPVSWSEAFILESLGQAIRGAAFLIPGGLGVQEGGYLGLGLLLGVPPPAALGLSLVKRVRELAFGLPGLIAWHRLERRAARDNALAITPE